MKWIRRVANTLRRSRLDAEIDEELRSHLEMSASALHRQGLSEPAARTEAARRLGNAASLRDRIRDVDVLVALETMLQDAGHALRFLLHSPGYTATAVLTLALGIGAAAAVLSVADAVILRGLPFADADRIVSVLELEADEAAEAGSGLTTSQSYIDWRRLQQSFDGLAAAIPWSFDVRNERGEPARVSALRVTLEFFPVLGAHPVLGRPFGPDDEIAGRHRVALLSHGFWQRRFGSSPGAVGGRIDLGTQSYEIVGVLGPEFTYPVGVEPPIDLYVPLAFGRAAGVRSSARMHNLTVLGRLGPGQTVQQAQHDMARIAAGLNEQYPSWNDGRIVRVMPLHERLVGHTRPWMAALLGAAAFVFLIACANVANLMLARASTRGRELAIRAALGAGRWRVLRAAVMEALALSLAGAAIGVGLAFAGVRVLWAELPPELPRIGDVAVNLRVLGTAVALSIAAGVACAAAPGLQSLRRDVLETLRNSGLAHTPGRAIRRFQGIVLAAEVALALALVAGASLFVTSFVNLARVEPGFDVRNVLMVPVSLPPGQGRFEETLQRGAADIRRMLDAVEAAAGVRAAGAVYGGVPLTDSWTRTTFERPERPGTAHEIDRRTVSAGYLETLGVPLLVGRALGPEDSAGSPPVALVSDSAARRFWPGQAALGHRMTIDGRARTIVGIVGDIRHAGPEAPARPEVYIPMTQDLVLGATLLVRTEGEPLAALPAVKSAIWTVNPEQRFDDEVGTLERALERLVARRRFNMGLLSLFGMTGLLLAAVGIHGVAHYVVAQRRREIGLRIALGASRTDVAVAVIRQIVLIMAAGSLIGAAAAWQLGGILRAFLFQIEPGDPRILTGAVCALLLAGLVACGPPLRNALRIQPLEALRHE